MPIDINRRSILLMCSSFALVIGSKDCALVKAAQQDELISHFDKQLQDLILDLPSIAYMAEAREAGVVIESLPEAALPKAPKSTTKISDRANQLIITCEVSSSTYYDRALQSPTWPRGDSGLTVGIGYDIGYTDKSELNQDWSNWIDQATINKLSVACGIKGVDAKKFVSSLSSAKIPYNIAIQEYNTEILPRYIGLTETTLDNCSELSSDSLGALVSLVYNRGPTWLIPASKDPAGNYQEMRNIKAHMKNMEFSAILDEIRHMIRLWVGNPDMRGVVTRRMLEANLFEIGLRE